MLLPVLTTITFILNIICGFFRVRQEKLKMKLLYIHIPIPLIAFLRITWKISWKFIPFFVMVAIVGQFLGGKLNAFTSKKVILISKNEERAK